MLEKIKGLGPKTLKILNNYNLNSISDLVNYYPYKYNIIVRSKELIDGEIITIDGILENNANVFYFKKYKDRMTFRLNIGSKILNVAIFNRGYLKSKLLTGASVYIIGKYDRKKETVTATDIYFGKLPSYPIIEPVYHAIHGISNKQLKTFISEALTLYHESSLLPKEIIDKYHFFEYRKVLQEIHNPHNEKDLQEAINYIKYEELFLFTLKINYLKQVKDKMPGLKREVDYPKVETFINKLPFTLTPDQYNCVKDIYDDLINPSRMNRLVQGDVGSGKTIVSFIALYINYLGGYQGTLMAPTEILAQQHYQNMLSLFKDTDIKVSILTRKTTTKEKKQIVADLEKGNIDIVIGTHALLSSDIKFSNLGLVITDEQHRFGVNQRSILKNKGLMPDILYMSATPIPRTYALTLYGDMDVSNIKTMPSGRKPVITYVKQNKDIKDVLEAMLLELKKGHQIYVVVPMILEQADSDYTSVNEMYENMHKAFGKYYQLGLLHGKMKNQEKEDVMQKFKNNEIQILVSTTVIEVGVDVSNATMIVIFNSERFGLSTLHQLRGRVGRNDLDSYCYLISDMETKRLRILENTYDGYKISEEDFKLRGSGDLFGLRQSGDMIFKMADIKMDFHLLKQAKEDSFSYLHNPNYQNDYLQNFIKQYLQLD